MEFSNLVNKVVADIDAQKVRDLWETYLARIGRPKTSDEEDALMENFAHQTLKIAKESLDSDTNFFLRNLTRPVTPIYSIGSNWGEPIEYVPSNSIVSMTINRGASC